MILRILLLTVFLREDFFGNNYVVLSNTSLHTFKMAQELMNGAGKSDKIGKKTPLLSTQRSNPKTRIRRTRHNQDGNKYKDMVVSSATGLKFAGQQAVMERLCTKKHWSVSATGSSVLKSHSVNTLQYGMTIILTAIKMKHASNRLDFKEAEKSLRVKGVRSSPSTKTGTSKHPKPQGFSQLDVNIHLKPRRSLESSIQKEAPFMKLQNNRLTRDLKPQAINFSIADGNGTSAIMKKEEKSTPQTQDMEPSTPYLQTEKIQMNTAFPVKTSFTNRSTNTTSSTDRWAAFIIGVDYVLGFYSVVAFIGCLGNIYVLFDAFKALRRLHTNEIFLIQLCIINILILLTLTTMVIFMKIGFHFTCHVIFSLTSVYLYGKVYTLTTISIQQYHAIVFPFKPKPSLRALMSITIMICVVSISLSLPVIIYQELLPRPCTSFKMEILYLRRLYYTLTALFQYILPLLIIAIHYAKLALFLKRSRIEIERHVDDQRQFQSPRKRRDRRVVMVMVTIVITFAICLLPQHIQFFIIEFITNGTLYNGMAVYSYFPILLKACIDTVVYGAIGRKLRTRCCCSKSNTGSIGPRNT